MFDDRKELKIIVLGNKSTNKCQFVNRWTKNSSEETYKATIVSEYGFKIFEKDGKLYRIQIWDLAGRDDSIFVSKLFAKGAHGFVVMSDARNCESREFAIKWKESIDDIANFNNGEKIPILLVENNVDLLEKNKEEDEITLRELSKKMVL